MISRATLKFSIKMKSKLLKEQSHVIEFVFYNDGRMCTWAGFNDRVCFVRPLDLGSFRGGGSGEG